MKSLEDHNKEALGRFMNPPRNFNGIECPKCGKELEDNPYMVLTSHPPQIPIFCECGYRGARY
jgi:hypothetical protein